MLVLGGAVTLLAIGTNWSTGRHHSDPAAGPARRRGHRRTIVPIIAPFVLGFTDHTVAPCSTS
jgi:hypothetical protein